MSDDMLGAAQPSRGVHDELSAFEDEATWMAIDKSAGKRDRPEEASNGTDIKPEPLSPATKRTRTGTDTDTAAPTPAPASGDKARRNPKKVTKKSCKAASTRKTASTAAAATVKPADATASTEATPTPADASKPKAAKASRAARIDETEIDALDDGLRDTTDVEAMKEYVERHNRRLQQKREKKAEETPGKFTDLPDEEVLLQVQLRPDRVHTQHCKRGRTRIGRGKLQNLVILSQDVSGYHAELVVSKRGVRLQDMASTNGTYINYKRDNGFQLEPYQPYKLAHGDTINFGCTPARVIIQKKAPRKAKKAKAKTDAKTKPKAKSKPASKPAKSQKPRGKPPKVKEEKPQQPGPGTASAQVDSIALPGLAPDRQDDDAEEACHESPGLLSDVAAVPQGDEPDMPPPLAPDAKPDGP